MSALPDSQSAINKTGSWTHTTSASAVNSGVLLIKVGTTTVDTPPTTVTVNGTSVHGNNIPNSGSVETSSDTMGCWAYICFVGNIAASQSYSIVVSGGAGSWESQSTMWSGASQLLSAYTPLVAGQSVDNPGNITGASVTLAVPTNGAIDNFIILWAGTNTGGTMTGNGSGVLTDTTGYNVGYCAAQYTTVTSPLTWTFNQGLNTSCCGSWGIPGLQVPTIVSQAAFSYGG